MNEIIQFTISGILTFMFYQYYAKKISDEIPLFSSFFLINIMKMMKINFINNNPLLIPYYIFFIMCLKNIVMCFKGKIALLKVLLIIFAFIIMTYVIMY